MKIIHPEATSRTRREFLRLFGLSAGLVFSTSNRAEGTSGQRKTGTYTSQSDVGFNSRPIKLFLCGDIMTGRGIDQVLAKPVDPRIYEPYINDARDYVLLAEEVNGPIPRPVDHTYVWGDALAAFAHVSPDARIINLETAVTTHDEPWPHKGIHYRMHPENIGLLTAAGIDCCVLANNHILDWGYGGLDETLSTLNAHGIQTTGAGLNGDSASTPAILPIAHMGRVLVFSAASRSSGVPADWVAGRQRAGVNLVSDDRKTTLDSTAALIDRYRRPGDIVVYSIHWGGNWGFEIPGWQRRFAHGLIDVAGVDLVHGHSSHHVKGIEVYRGKPIIYGCGDLINDYEGISPREAYRGDLSMMYFPSFDPVDGALVEFELSPMRMKKFRLNHASRKGSRWLQKTLNREGAALGTSVVLKRDNIFELEWT